MGGGGGPIGQIFSVIGDQAASSAESYALQQNGDWFMEQAQFAHDSTQRELKIHDQESAQFYGEKITQISRGGIDMSGSPLLLLAFTKMQQSDQRKAIIAQGDIQYKEATLKGTAAYRQSSDVSSAANMRLIGGAIGIGTSALSLGASGGSGSNTNNIYGSSSNSNAADAFNSRGRA